MNSGTIWGRLVEKTRGKKSRATVPLSYRADYNLVLSGDRNSGQRAQKGPGKKVGRKYSLPNFGQILAKAAEKGPKKI